MESLEIEKIIFKFIFNKGKISINKTIELVLKYCDNMKQDVINNTNIKNIQSSLFEYLYVFNYLYKSIGLLVLTNPSTEINTIDLLLKKYNDKFFENKNIYEKLIILSSKTNNEYSNILNKIIKEFEQKNDENKEIMVIEINKLCNLIKKELEKNYQLPVNEQMKKYLPDKEKSKINLTRQNYNFLQRTVKDPELRNLIEQLYFKKSDSSMIMFTKLVLLRHKYANLSGYKTYYELIKKKSQASSDDVKILINDLISKLEERSRKEIERIHRELNKDNYDNKVNLPDIIYYYEKLKTKNLFIPNNVLKVIIEIFHEYFNIVIEQQDEKLFHNNVSTYVVKNNSVIMGYLYLDLSKRKNKSIVSPTSIHLCQQYVGLNNNIYHTKVFIISGYESLTEKCITYSDIVSLFREFGYAIQLMAYNTNKGIIFKNDFDMMLSQIL